MFYVGQKVVCVQAGPDFFGRPIWVVKGDIYTIADVFDSQGVSAVRLVEAPKVFNELGWIASWFRPVQEKKTDISIFTDLLIPVDHKQLEDA